MPNYVRAQATAKRVIAKAGRAVQLLQLDATVPDPTQPWRGPIDPRATPTKVLNTFAAFVSVTSNSDLGIHKTVSDMIKSADEVCMVASTEDLTLYQELVDSLDGRHYKIMAAQALAPGPLLLFSFLVLKQ